MNTTERHWLVDQTSYVLRQLVWTVSEGVSEVLPLVTPLPLVAIIVWELANWVLPFGETMNWIVAVIGGLTMEFLGMVAILLYEQVKAYNATRPKEMGKISTGVPIAAMVYYILAAGAMITFGTVLPAAGYDSKATAPYMLYPFILLVFFGYLFIGVKSNLTASYREIEAQKATVAEEERKQAEAEAKARREEFEARQRELEAARQQAEVARQQAETERLQAEAAAIRAEADATRMKAEAEKIRAKNEKPVPAQIVLPTPASNGFHDWRKATWSEINEWLVMGLAPDDLKPAEVDRLNRLQELFQDGWFSTAQAQEHLDVGSVNTILGLLKVAYARKLVEVSGNQYRIVETIKIG